MSTSRHVLAPTEPYAERCSIQNSKIVDAHFSFVLYGFPIHARIFDGSAGDFGNSRRRAGGLRRWQGPPNIVDHTIKPFNRVLTDDHSDAMTDFSGATWTTDAPLRETEMSIAYAQSDGILGVEMEASALYAFSEAKGFPVICFAHITNQMGNVENDFEKGEAQGSLDAIDVITQAAEAWSACIS